MRFLSLCSGIGGIDLAAEWAGMEIVGQVEIDPYCQAVLAKHWPSVKRMGDIREVVGDEFGPVDILAGGIPCQPWSVAGRQRGARDDRHLWPQMRRLVEVMQPAWVVVENVAGFARLALDDVCADLDARGYEVTAYMVPAAAVGAPHLRERVFVVAHASGGRSWSRGDHRRQRVLRDLNGQTSEGVTAGYIRERGAGASGNVADAASVRDRRQPQRTAQTQPQLRITCDPKLGDATQRRLRRGAAQGQSGQPTQPGQGVGLADPYDAGLTGAPRLGELAGRRSLKQSQRQAQSRVGRVTDGLPRGLDGVTGDAQSGEGCPRHPWPAGPSEPQHAWEAPRTVTSSVPNRASRLKALGNAVVPQQVYPILAAIMAVEQAA